MSTTEINLYYYGEKNSQTHRVYSVKILTLYRKHTYASRIKVSSDVCLFADNIVVAGSVIPYVKTVKYLGVVIDNTLSWEHQVTKMCNQAMSSLAQLKINNEVFNTELQIRLNYRQLFGSKLQFLEVAMRRGDIRQDYLRLPMSTSNIYDKSFLIQGIRVWNSLPAGLTTVDDLTEFQNH
ncbi:Protein of unknown function [Cotesia congregata]|uniref:Uncharacterized protein n=1 Tax=Cotesia congregata TaxID=51543 RepID=A0A8J2EHE8_COTCN|nr:Protein of unknown function [Cotesia congregata]